MSSSFPFDQDDARRAQVLRQVEYYFCDENLPYDQFLLRHADPSGAIESSVLANSNRIVEYLPSMSPTERAKVVFDVGARSDSIQQVGDSKLSRRRPLPLDDPAASRSVYARFSKASIHESRTFTIPHRKLREHRETRDFTGEVIFEFETRAASDVSQ
ncbi:hypothetical protein CTAYLR_005369 [Chrysophaeum taylorii]|uniref:HTH La-type RNA-binding domain-containing protein n=1 Tax=Chrysophaeum taylorii TaxID=2483200 RepID=A0AAD7U985_9STRA|nr:hypothetical protein CTAYLR_005369 [Chrysophaeum taylorii]